MKVIVVGAGVLGAAVSRELAVAGSEVVLLDKQGAGAGTTSTTFAWTNSNRKLDPAYHRLNVAALEAHAALASQLPGRVLSGALHWSDPAHEEWLESNVLRLSSLGYPVRRVQRDEAAVLCGNLRIPSEATAFAHFPGEGYVLPDQFVRSLVADAERHGAHLVIGEVVSVDDNTASVTLADGRVLTGDRVIMATGRWTEELAAGAGIDVPMVTGVHRGSPVIGLLGYARSPEIDLRCVVHSPTLNLRPAADGAVVQALDLNAGVDPLAPPTPDGPIAAEITRRLVRLLPAGSAEPRLDLRIGFRSLPLDGHTIAGYASPASRIYCLVSHSGITLAPLLGRLAATEILTGREQDLLDGFRPARFAGRHRPEVEAGRHATRMGEQ